MSDQEYHAGAVRWFAGLTFSADRRDATAALLRTVDRGLEARPAVVATRRESLPREAAQALLLTQAEPAAAGEAPLSLQLAAAGAQLVNKLLEEHLPSGAPLPTLAVDDPGCWQVSAERMVFRSLSDAAQLSELTGCDVVDAFAARDLAAGGLGGPLTALPEWLLLRDPRRSRALVHLGRTARLVFLPPGVGRHAANEVMACDIGPGTRLLDLLAQKLTTNQHRFDPGGHLAVQGRQVAELLDLWLADPYFDRPLPRWHPRGVRPERFLNDAIPKALERGWSVRDMLCTATHLVAETVARAVNRHVRRLHEVDEVVLSGGGKQNGLLLRELATRLRDVAFLRATELGVPSGALRAAAIGGLGQLFVDQIPAGLPALTGAAEPRVVGRWTPGALRRSGPARLARPHFDTRVRT